MSRYETVNSSFVAPILDLLPDAIIWVYPLTGSSGMVEDFQVGYSNRSADTAINHPKGSLTGLCVLKDGVPSMESAQANFEHFLQVYQTGEPSEYTFYAHHAGLQLETRRVVYEGGILSTTRDRRAQREAERKEQEKTLLLDNILTHSSNGITVGEMIRDAKGNIIDIKTLIANDAAVRFTGFSKEDYLTKTGAALDPSFTRSAYFQMCVQCMETGVPFITQYFLEGLGAWLEVSVSKMDDNRQIYIFTDVTPIKEAQMALESSARQLTTIINTTQAGFFMIRPVYEGNEITDFRFTLVNQVMAAFVGDQAEDLVDQPASLKFETYKTNGLFERLRDVYLTGVQQQFDIHYSGKIVDAWVNMRITKVGDKVLGTFTDITQLKTLQLQLEQNIEELKRSNAYLEEFAHAASHDLKEPIRKIQTFSDRLQSSLKDRLTEGEAGIFQRMHTAASRMNQLVEDLLTYSQVSETPLQKEEVNLNKKVQIVLSDLDVQIEEKKAVIEVHSLPVVNGYRRQLQQLFQNLISNALKYSKQDTPPRIVISSRSITGADLAEQLPAAMWEQHYYLIEVQDNGIGFEQEYADHIFKMFQRLHGRSEYEGTGIGLSIARKVIDNHQGYIWAQSRIGEGARFSFLLPQD
ncbi:PAS domain-containing protein [Cnuella takakiae]|uniref:histidine kinase n=1 Tax=Cnuella takakiae TaxID=1302690 RepID=A0A1M4SW60_9BACT|nr:PAS domain-containing sensor histidine kinase [Cnuella takakiae]OLY90614.1 hypothetical protein BUE76_00850 [Cnuella takakiae]SHE36450.1 PAS domain-containing protein [Cnuella takakiae]